MSHKGVIAGQLTSMTIEAAKLGDPQAIIGSVGIIGIYRPDTIQAPSLPIGIQQFSGDQSFYPGCQLIGTGDPGAGRPAPGGKASV